MPSSFEVFDLESEELDLNYSTKESNVK